MFFCSVLQTYMSIRQVPVFVDSLSTTFFIVNASKTQRFALFTSLQIVHLQLYCHHRMAPLSFPAPTSSLGHSPGNLSRSSLHARSRGDHQRATLLQPTSCRESAARRSPGPTRSFVEVCSPIIAGSNKTDPAREVERQTASMARQKSRKDGTGAAKRGKQDGSKCERFSA